MRGRMKRNESLNKLIDGKPWRCCKECDTWKLLTDFTEYSSYFGYVCKACVADQQRARNLARRAKRTDRKERRQPFDKHCVDSQGLSRFLSQPRPSEPIEEQAA